MPSSQAPIPLRYAGFAPRAVAAVVDAFLVLGICLLLLPLAYGQPIPAAVIWVGAIWALMIAYCVVGHARWGRTVGKMIAGIKVRRVDGDAIGYREALLRSSVDICFAAIGVIALSTVVSEWAGPDWSSLPYIEKLTLIRARDPANGIHSVAGEIWAWSELVVLMLNKKRRALHDFIAGTVVVVE